MSCHGARRGSTNEHLLRRIHPGRTELATQYEAIVQHLQRGGHVVLSEHVASATIDVDEWEVTDQQIFTQDIALLERCDAGIAEVTVPSLGVGFEIAYALHHLGKPVLCLCQRGVHLSAMLVGNTDPKMRIAFYTDLPRALAEVDRFLLSVTS